MGVEFGVNLGFESWSCLFLFSLGESFHSVNLSLLIKAGGSTTRLEDLMCGTKEVLCKNTTPLQVLVTVRFSLSGSILKPLHTFHPQNAYVYGNIPRKMTISIFFPGVHISKGQSSEFQRSLCVTSVWASSLGNQSSRTHQVNSQQ